MNFNLKENCQNLITFYRCFHRLLIKQIIKNIIIEISSIMRRIVPDTTEGRNVWAELVLQYGTWVDKGIRVLM